MPSKKSPKGTVTIQTLHDRLRLRWSFGGKRYHLSLELPDSATNRKIAEARARIIERDMAMESFDPTLERYKPNSIQGSISVVELFNRFKEFRSKNIYPQSLAKYEGLIGYLKQFFRSKGANAVGESEAEKFKDFLL